MWSFLLCISIGFIILEMLLPSAFFLNFAFSALICAGVSLFISNIYFITILFTVLSVIFIYVLRPVFVNKERHKALNTGIEGKYIGKIAKAVEKIDSNRGAISIYDERWQAKTENNEIIEAGQDVEIIKNESIVMIVKAITLNKENN